MILGIISDIHEDIHSLRLAMDIFAKQKCDELICLGDIIGYEPKFYPKIKMRNSSECISIIRKEFKYVVAGNHDLYCIKKLPNPSGSWNYPLNWYELPLELKKEISGGKIWLYENEALDEPLSDSDIEFLDSLPESIAENFQGIKMHFSHSVYPDLTGSYFFRLHNPWELKKHFNHMSENDIDISFSGHMHENFAVRACINSIEKIQYNKNIKLLNNSHYISPNIVNRWEKRGLLIVDLEQNSIKSIKLNAGLSLWQKT